MDNLRKGSDVVRACLRKVRRMNPKTLLLEEETMMQQCT